MLLLPPYLLLGVTLLLFVALRRPIVVDGRTAFGPTLKCRLPDLIQTYLWLFGEWEPDLTRFIAGRLKEGDLFVDVGANVGYYSLLAAECVGITGRVVSVEASPEVFGELRANVAANGVADRVRLENTAAGAEPGTLTLFSGHAHNVGMTSTVHTRGAHERSVVEARRLDEMLTAQDAAAARLIKIDVEGAEPDVVTGMANLLHELPDDAEIVIELSPRWWPDRDLIPADVLRPFTDAGFHVYELANSYSVWRYLWCNDVTDAVRVRGALTRRVAQLDLVLSRIDADRLPVDPSGFMSKFGAVASPRAAGSAT